MATKTKSSKTKAAKAKKPATKRPSYENLLHARREMDLAQSEVRVAERLLRSALSVNTAAHREVEVADARTRLNSARLEAAEATARFQAMKFQGSGKRR